MEKYHSPPLSSENLLWLRLGTLGTNFSGFYVNGKFYYKLTGIAIHYKDVSLRLENEKNEQNWPHLLSGWFLTKLWTFETGTFSWIESQLDCKWKLECFFCPEKCKGIVKIGEIFLVVRKPKKFRKMTKKVVRNSEIFPRKCRLFLVVREQRSNLSSGPRVGKGWEPLG